MRKEPTVPGNGRLFALRLLNSSTVGVVVATAAGSELP